MVAALGGSVEGGAARTGAYRRETLEARFGDMVPDVLIALTACERREAATPANLAGFLLAEACHDHRRNDRWLCLVLLRSLVQQSAKLVVGLQIVLMAVLPPSHTWPPRRWRRRSCRYPYLSAPVYWPSVGHGARQNG